MKLGDQIRPRDGTLKKAMSSVAQEVNEEITGRQSSFIKILRTDSRASKQLTNAFVLSTSTFGTTS